MLKRRRRNTAEYSTHLQQLRCVKSKYPSFVPWRRQDPYCLHEPLHYSWSWMFPVAPWEFPMSRCVHTLLVLQGLHLLVRHLQQFKQVRGTIFNWESSVIKYCIGFVAHFFRAWGNMHVLTFFRCFAKTVVITLVQFYFEFTRESQHTKIASYINQYIEFLISFSSRKTWIRLVKDDESKSCFQFHENGKSKR